MKRTVSQQEPSRVLLAWLNSTLNCQEAKVEHLGNGLAYCLLMHHYYPRDTHLRRICMIPRRLPDHIANLRYLAELLALLKLHHITFDINKVAANSYPDNLQLLAKLHAVLTKSQASLVRSREDSQVHAPKIPGRKVQPALSAMTPNSYPLASFNCFSAPLQNQMQLIHMGLATPVKGSLKNPNPNQPTVLESIKNLIGSKQLTDRQKVKDLKHMLGIEVEDSKYCEQEEKDLLSDDNKKDQTIVIEDS